MLDMTGTTSREWEVVLRADPCSYCGSPGGTVDHITPKAWRSRHEGPSGMTGACERCNGAKGVWPLLPFLLLREWAPDARRAA
jgi:5-methylcytosine-specific restriction endonuclease McrA